MNNNTTHHNNSSSSQDFPIAIALLALLSIALLVVSYYIFIIKCCFNWHTLDPLRRFSFSRNSHHSHLTNFSTLTIPDIFTHQHRGLDEWLINNIPAFQYKPTSFGNSIRNSHSGERSFRSGCAVCLNEFQDQEMLRILPRCSHIFHLDCIDVWLLNNASCPLCRSSISGRTKYPLDHIIAPSSSPDNGYDPDYVVIEIDHNQGLEPDYASNPVISSQVNHKGSAKMKKVSKFQRFSIMGDECINVISNKDEQFCVQQPIRRSFSMDSVVDRGLYLQLQEMITRQSRAVSDRNHVNDESQGNGRVRRGSFFSFGSFRSSSVIPLESDR